MLLLNQLFGTPDSSRWYMMEVIGENPESYIIHEKIRDNSGEDNSYRVREKLLVRSIEDHHLLYFIPMGEYTMKRSATTQEDGSVEIHETMMDQERRSPPNIDPWERLETPDSLGMEWRIFEGQLCLLKPLADGSLGYFPLGPSPWDNDGRNIPQEGRNLYIQEGEYWDYLNIEFGSQSPDLPYGIVVIPIPKGRLEACSMEEPVYQEFRG